jgi:hypothetical protein
MVLTVKKRFVCMTEGKKWPGYYGITFYEKKIQGVPVIGRSGEPLFICSGFLLPLAGYVGI